MSQTEWEWKKRHCLRPLLLHKHTTLLPISTQMFGFCFALCVVCLFVYIILGWRHTPTKKKSADKRPRCMIRWFLYRIYILCVYTLASERTSGYNENMFIQIDTVEKLNDTFFIRVVCEWTLFIYLFKGNPQVFHVIRHCDRSISLEKVYALFTKVWNEM